MYFEFRTEQNLAFWKITNLDRPGVRDGCLTGTVLAPGLTLESGSLSVDAAPYRALEILIRSDKAGLGYVHWTREGSDETFSSNGSTYAIRGDNRHHLITIDFSGHKTRQHWQGKITSLKLDVIRRANAEVRLKSIRFVPRRATFPNADLMAFDDEGELVGWTTAVESGEVSMEVDRGRAGRDGRLRCTVDRPRSVGYFMVRLDGACPGETYRAKGSYRAAGGSRPFLGVRFIGINGHEINRIMSDASKEQLREDRGAAALDFVIPPQAADVLLCYGISGDRGSVTWKDIELAEGAPIARKTDLELLRLTPEEQETYPTDWPVGTDLAQEITCTVDVRNGAPRLFVNGQVVSPYLYGPPVRDTYGPQAGLRLVERMAERGIHLHGIYVGYYAGSREDYMGAWAPDWWTGPDTYDFSRLDADIRETLAKDPRALIVLKVGINAPDWWLARYPEELTEYVDGSRDFQSFASPVWHETMGEALRQLVRHVQNSDYAQRIIGYLPGAGISFEWQYWGAHPFTWAGQEKMGDYCKPMLAYFREWLMRKYDGDVERLRAAWHDPAVTFETASIPRKEKRYASEIFCFRDPKRTADVMDYLECLSACTADAIIHFCKILKDAADGRALTGVHYGYLLIYSGYPMLHSGHLGLSKTLRSPYVDFYSGASIYGRIRFPGGPAGYIYPVDSLHLHGKLILNDEDHRTHRTDKGGMAFVGITDMRDNVQTMRRNTLLNLTRNVGMQWHELLPGWFEERITLDTLGRLKRIYDGHYGRPRRRNEIAVFVDDKSMFYFRHAPEEILGHLIPEQQIDLGLMGAPYDTYLLSDLRAESFPDYKLYIFLNAFALNDAARALIARRLKRDGKTLVWIHAAGIFNGQAMSSRFMEDLTGLPVVCDLIAHAQVVRITDDRHPLTRGMAGRLIGETNPQGPLFHVDTSGPDVLGRIRGTDKAGLVARDMGNWRSIYVATVGLPAWLLRNMARYAGVHVYCDSDDAVYTDGNLIAIHAQCDGRKRIRLPFNRDVYDLFRKTRIAENTAAFELDMEAGSTEAFRLDEVE